MELLIADSSQSFYEAVKRRLVGEFTVRYCADGEEALRELNRKTPDILLLHLALPRKDGLTVLLQTTRRPEKIVVMTNYTSKAVERQLFDLGVRQMLVQPTVNTVVMWVSELGKGENCQLPRERFSRRLQSLGFSSAVGGYEKILQALILLDKNPDLRLKDHVYPYVGVAAEKSIRDAIASAYSRGDRQAWMQLFPTGKPSNKAFLRRILQVDRDRMA